MLKIGIVGCGLQAATIASYLSVYGDEYEVVAVMDMNVPGSKARMAQKGVKVAENCIYTPDVASFIASAPKMDGIIIGTYCASHTDIACELEKLHVPLYIEKPVAIDFAQVNKLYNTFKNSSTPIQVSLPMRLCPLTQEAKKIIESGKIGKVCQVVGFEDTDGEVYFTTWFRDADKTGGMFMQKAVHDIDYILYLAKTVPAEVCAMRTKPMSRPVTAVLTDIPVSMVPLSVSMKEAWRNPMKMPLTISPPSALPTGNFCGNAFVQYRKILPLRTWVPAS